MRYGTLHPNRDLQTDDPFFWILIPFFRQAGMTLGGTPGGRRRA
jgi:hypothetical protein